MNSEIATPGSQELVYNEKPLGEALFDGAAVR